MLSGFAPSFPLRPFGTPFSRCSSPFAFVRLLFLLFAVLVCPKKCFFSSLSLFSSVLRALDFLFRSAVELTTVLFTHLFFIEVTFATTHTPLSTSSSSPLNHPTTKSADIRTFGLLATAGHDEMMSAGTACWWRGHCKINETALARKCTFCFTRKRC